MKSNLPSLCDLQIPSRKAFLALYEIYLKRVVTFDTNTIFKDRQQFKRTMQRLVKWNAIKQKVVLDGADFVMCYQLTVDGTVFVESFLIDYHECQIR